jgi:ABC-type branched-subunit amino acid transport system substrate-binding protein
MPILREWTTETRAKLIVHASQIRGWWAKHDSEVWLAVIFAVVVAIVIEIGKDGWVGPQTYKVYLVGDYNQTSGIKDLFTSFQNASSSWPLEIDGVPIKIELRDDQGLPKEATALAKELSKDDSTLLVVGNVYSELTKQTLPLYMTATPRIPVIAATETDDDLEKICGDNCKNVFAPVLQMAPTNEAQAESAVSYAIAKKRTRCLVIYDDRSPNTDYADNLRDDFVNSLNVHRWQGIKLITSPWNMALGIILHDSDIKSYDPDCIFFAGPVEPARSLISTLSLIAQKKNITVFLPDSAVGASLLSDQILDNYKPLFYTYPTNAAYFSSKHNVFGADAFQIVKQLVSDADTHNPTFMESLHNFFGMHRVTDARAQIIREMQRKAESGASYKGEVSDIEPTGENYKFWGFKRDDAKFHVWEVQDHQVVDVDDWHQHETGKVIAPLKLANASVPSRVGTQ